VSGDEIKGNKGIKNIGRAGEAVPNRDAKNAVAGLEEHVEPVLCTKVEPRFIAPPYSSGSGVFVFVCVMYELHISDHMFIYKKAIKHQWYVKSTLQNANAKILISDINMAECLSEL
jgi:hypothetical protein